MASSTTVRVLEKHQYKHQEDEVKEGEEEEDGTFPKARHVFGFMGFLGFAVVYSMRVNLSVAIVTMVNQTAIPHVNLTEDDQSCPISPSLSSNQTTKPRQLQGEFEWDEATQGLVLGSFYYGYMLTQIPGGRLAELYGGKLVYGLGVFITAVLTLLTPLAARWNLPALVALRAIEGLAEGVTYPAIHVMVANWVPPFERSTFSAVVYCGCNIGTVISLPLAGWLCSLEFQGGWPLAFYIFGILGMIWFAFWMWLVADSPARSNRISEKERNHIERALRSVKKIEDDDDDADARNIPWLALLTSPPLWAIMVTQFGWMWTFLTLITELPTYMDQILHFDIQSNSALSALPYFTAWIMGILCCSFADWLLNRKYISLLNSYRLWNSVGSIIPSIGLIGVAYVGCSGTWVMFMLAVLGAFNGATYAGFQMNHIALSPKYAGTVYGITNTAGSMSGFLGPYITGLVINGNNTLAQWRYVFYLAAVVSFIGNAFYFVFASTEEQSWSINSKKSKERAETEKFLAST
ncbi:sialin-like isoform X2 [Eupeodes corollae]|uniref:sialin-like isoform X2 n=1 Tax=Eupeodes corollae TaxID=290404 RepID=UPI0024902835|nr:sialin-like isoform X2 [Eupeodes corollae]